MRDNKIITITAGTPIRLFSGKPAEILADRIFIQALPGAAVGLVYVFVGVPGGTTPVFGTTPAAILEAPTATAPGGSYSDTMADAAGIRDPIKLSEVWIDGATNDTEVLVSWNRIL